MRELDLRVRFQLFQPSPFQPRDQAGLIPSVSVVPSDLMMERGSELRGWLVCIHDPTGFYFQPLGTIPGLLEFRWLRSESQILRIPMCAEIFTH